MDRNLGASQVATSSTDETSYGDLFQWGRGDDSHQGRSSGTINIQSVTDNPGHGDFIIAFEDWRSTKNHNLWQGISSINNPCPSGFRVPTEGELNAERTSWNSNNEAGAFASALKLSMGGYRLFSDASLFNVDTYGFYWSGTVISTGSRGIRVLFFESTDSNWVNSSRSNGCSVRCIKD